MPFQHQPQFGILFYDPVGYSFLKWEYAELAIFIDQFSEEVLPGGLVIDDGPSFDIAQKSSSFDAVVHRDTVGCEVPHIGRKNKPVQAVRIFL